MLRFATAMVEKYAFGGVGNLLRVKIFLGIEKLRLQQNVRCQESVELALSTFVVPVFCFNFYLKETCRDLKRRQLPCRKLARCSCFVWSSPLEECQWWFPL